MINKSYPDWSISRLKFMSTMKFLQLSINTVLTALLPSFKHTFVSNVRIAHFYAGQLLAIFYVITVLWILESLHNVALPCLLHLAESPL